MATNDRLLLQPPQDSPSASSSVFDFPQASDHTGWFHTIARQRLPTARPPAGAHADPIPQLSIDRSTGAEHDRAKHNKDDAVAYVVISGGTGCNAICSAFGLNATYVLPVSDNGGSSSEIIRVLGGPSIGDIRSRLIRLIPNAPHGSPLDAIRTLLAYRLPADSTDRQAREEWRDIVEGRSHLWDGIPNDRKETIRGFLVYFESELLKRAHKNFSFRNGSVGNYFLAAAQGFFRSLPSAIFLFSSITGSQAQILPLIVTNHTVTIAADLASGSTLIGQCEISHPVAGPRKSSGRAFDFQQGLEDDVEHEPQNVIFQKKEQEKGYESLDSSISRVYYINAYGQEIYPSPNPDFLRSIATHDILVYSCGSLWTSIIPCLALRGVASAIAKSTTIRAKVLLLNSDNDRETHGYTATDYIRAIADTLNRQDLVVPSVGPQGSYPESAFVTHLVYTRSTSIPIDKGAITSLGVKCVEVDGTRFDTVSVSSALKSILSEDR